MFCVWFDCFLLVLFSSFGFGLLLYILFYTNIRFLLFLCSTLLMNITSRIIHSCFRLCFHGKYVGIHHASTHLTFRPFISSILSKVHTIVLHVGSHSIEFMLKSILRLFPSRVPASWCWLPAHLTGPAHYRSIQFAISPCSAHCLVGFRFHRSGSVWSEKWSGIYAERSAGKWISKSPGVRQISGNDYRLIAVYLMDESTIFCCLSVMSADHHTQREKWENSSSERNKDTDKRDKDQEKIVFRLKKDTVVCVFRSRLAVVWRLSFSKKRRRFTAQSKMDFHFCIWKNRLRWQNPVVLGYLAWSKRLLFLPFLENHFLV